MTEPVADPTPGQKRYGRCFAVFAGVLVFMPVLSCFVFPSPHAEVLRALRGHDVSKLHTAAMILTQDASRHGAYGVFKQLFAPQETTRELGSLPPELLALKPRAVLVARNRVTLLWDAGTLGGSECGLVLAPVSEAAELKADFGAAALRPVADGAWSLVPLR